MRKISILVLSVVGAAMLAGCSKTVTKEAGVFRQTEPGPSPTVLPSPGPSPTPSPSPSPSPSPTPVACDPARVGGFLDYSVLAKEDLWLENIAIGGRVGATDAAITSAEIGTRLHSTRDRIDLAAAQTLRVTSVRVPHGKVTYGRSIENARSTALGGFSQREFDVKEQFAEIEKFLKSCGKVSGNTKIKRECRKSTEGCVEDSREGSSPENCTLTITGEKSLNFAELSPAQILNVKTFVIDIPKGASLVTNFPENHVAVFRGVAVKTSGRMDESPARASIFWNFPAADALEFGQTKFRGIVVAPGASVKIERQVGEAGFWTRTLGGVDSNL